MHVGLNLVFLTPGEQGGMETYVRELIPQLIEASPNTRFTAFVNADAARVTGPWHDTGFVRLPVHAANRLEWVRGEQQLLPLVAQRAGVEVLHSMASTAPGWGRFRRVVTIHDLIYKAMPDAHPGLRSWGMRVLVPLAARTTDRIIAISSETRRDLIDLLDVPAAKIDVVPQGLGRTDRRLRLDERSLRKRLHAGDRQIVLSVSAKLAHKNLSRLLLALAQISQDERPLLVLPGYPTPHEVELRRQAEALGIADDVRFLGWIPAADLEGLYAVATAVVLPSLAEGFGLPVLEAMARGRAVACSNRGALAEVAGDAALGFDPESERAIADAILQLLNRPDLRERLEASGPKRAAAFSWTRTAELTLASYRAAVSSGRR